MESASHSCIAIFLWGSMNGRGLRAVAGRWILEQSPAIGVVYRQELYAEQDHVTAANLKRWLQTFAGRHDLDEKAIVAALDDAGLRARVDSDLAGAATGAA